MSASKGQPDVIVVGLGPAGATAAYAMAKGGMKVLALEAGPQRSKEHYRLDEISESVFSGLASARSSTRSSRPGGGRRASPRGQRSIPWGR